MTTRSIITPLLAVFTLAACATEQPYEPPPDNYWVTVFTVEEATTCLVPAMDGFQEGRLHYEEVFLPGEYSEVRSENARVMGGGDLYYVSVRRHTVGSTLELHGYGEVSDALRPAIQNCV